MGTQPHQPGRLNIVNRNKYKTFQNSPIIPFKTDRRLKAVKLERICHDEVYADLKAKGLQIDITNPEILVNGKRPIDGIFSPLFGADTTQDIPIYSCDCRKLTGGTNLGAEELALREDSHLLLHLFVRVERLHGQGLFQFPLIRVGILADDELTEEVGVVGHGTQHHVRGTAPDIDDVVAVVVHSALSFVAPHNWNLLVNINFDRLISVYHCYNIYLVMIHIRDRIVFDISQHSNKKKGRELRTRPFCGINYHYTDCAMCITYLQWIM